MPLFLSSSASTADGAKSASWGKRNKNPVVYADFSYGKRGNADKLQDASALTLTNSFSSHHHITVRDPHQPVFD